MTFVKASLGTRPAARSGSGVRYALLKELKNPKDVDGLALIATIASYPEIAVLLRCKPPGGPFATKKSPTAFPGASGTLWRRAFVPLSLFAGRR